MPRARAGRPYGFGEAHQFPDQHRQCDRRRYRRARRRGAAARTRPLRHHPGMGDPPHRAAERRCRAGGRERTRGGSGERMKQSGGKGKPTAASPTPRRRRRLPRRIRRGALGLLLAVAVAGSYGAILASRMPAGQAALAQATDRFIAATGALGLVVSEIEVQVRETTDVGTVMAALSAARGEPILAVSPSRAKEQLESLPWVRSATTEPRLPGTLFVRLAERHPLAVWQHGGIQQLIEREGAVIPVDDLSRFAHLPTVVGDDAAPRAAT